MYTLAHKRMCTYADVLAAKANGSTMGSLARAGYVTVTKRKRVKEWRATALGVYVLVEEYHRMQQKSGQAMAAIKAEITCLQ